MKYNTLKALMLFWVLPLGCYAQVGNHNNHKDDSGSDDTQARFIKAVQSWKKEWVLVIPAKVTSCNELKAAIEALRPIDEESLRALMLRLTHWDHNRALFLASCVGNLSATRALLQAGVDANARDTLNRSPLHHAAGMGHLEIVKALLDAGANVNARDDRALTPLHYAVKAVNENVAVLAFLIESGAYVNARDFRARTPLDLAMRPSRRNVFVFLSNWAADCQNNNNNNNATIVIQNDINEDTDLMDLVNEIEEDATPVDFVTAFLNSFAP
jgi:ankyrin repeat protein